MARAITTKMPISRILVLEQFLIGSIIYVLLKADNEGLAVRGVILNATNV